MHYLHPNWLAQIRTKPMQRSQSLEFTLMHDTQLFGVKRRVLNLESVRFTSIIWLRVKQHLGTNTLFAKDHKSSVDGDPS